MSVSDLVDEFDSWATSLVSPTSSSAEQLDGERHGTADREGELLKEEPQAPLSPQEGNLLPLYSSIFHLPSSFFFFSSYSLSPFPYYHCFSSLLCCPGDVTRTWDAPGNLLFVLQCLLYRGFSKRSSQHWDLQEQTAQYRWQRNHGNGSYQHITEPITYLSSALIYFNTRNANHVITTIGWWNLQGCSQKSRTSDQREVHRKCA